MKSKTTKNPHSKMKRLPVSILIPTMNRPEALNKTISTLLSFQFVPDQIVIIDQSTDEETRNTIKRSLCSLNDQCDICYSFQEKPSLTIARNRGVSLSKHDILIFSDDDVDVNENTIKEIYDLMSLRTVSMVAGLDELTRESKSRIGYLIGTKSLAKEGTGYVTKSVLGRYPSKVTEIVPTQWAMGYFFAIRKSLLIKWSIRWDENLIGYAYAEDLDFSYAYYKQSLSEGLSCVLSPKVVVKHYGTLEYRVPNKKATSMYVINRLYLSYKHKMGIMSVFAVDWVNMCMLVMRFFKKQNWQDMLHAIKIGYIYRKEIKTGYLREDLYN